MVTKRHLVRMIMMGCLWGTIGHVCWAENTIYWFTINYPPAYFVEGKRQGEGFCDVAGKLFRQTLATYQHQFIANVSQPRMLEFWKETDTTYCVPGLGVTIGQFPDTVYSKTMSMVPSPGIMIRKAEKTRFINAPDEQVSIEKLLQDPTRVLAFCAECQYGDQINTLIKQHSGQPHLYARANIDQAALFKMLAAKRVDYVLVWAFAAQIALEALASEERDALLFIPVIEVPAAKDAHAVCNDTPLGRQVIEQINQILTTEAYKTVVTERLLEFLPETVRAQYRNINLQQIGQ